MRDVLGAVRGRSVLACLALLAIGFATSVYAEVQSGHVEIKATTGDAMYSPNGQDAWQPLKASTIVSRGAAIKTGSDATIDLVLQYNGTVLRLLPNSLLAFDKLDRESAG